MKKILFFVMMLMILTSCTNHKYKYRIEGYVETSKWSKHNCGGNCCVKSVVYADTFYKENKSLYYFNSNGKRVIVYSPKITKN